MIQRKQTIFLLLAFVAVIVCLYLPLGCVELIGMGTEPVLYNLALVDTNGVFDFSYCPLFIILALTGIIAFITVFLYKKRLLQARLCSLNIALVFVWMLVYIYYRYFKLVTIGDFNQSFSVCLPFISAILYYMAYKGIKADE